MNEIATYSMIASKTGLGPNGSECPTKTSILAIDELIIIDNSGSYASRECVRIRDIRKREISSDFVLTVTPNSMAFSPSGGTKTYTVQSYKNTTIEGSGATKEELPWTATISGSGFSNTDSDITATANNGGERTGSLLITQAESGKTVTISLRQTSADISYNYYLSVEPTSISFPDTGGSQNFTVTSYKKQVINGVEQTEQIPVNWSSSISGTGFSLSGTTVMASTNPGMARSGIVTITQAESNKTATITINQQGKPSPWVYTFKINPWESNIANTGGSTTSFTITSTKTKDGVTENVNWSIDNSTVPSWITFNQSSMTFTVQANVGAARSANIYFTQAESGNREFYRISQDKADEPWQYKFSAAPNNFSADDKQHVYTSTITSTKTRGDITENVGWNITSTLPDWVTINKVNNTTVNISISQNTTESSRTTTINLLQQESNKTVNLTINQEGKVPEPIEYENIFTVLGPNGESMKDFSVYSIDYWKQNITFKVESYIQNKVTKEKIEDVPWESYSEAIDTDGGYTVNINKETVSADFYVAHDINGDYYKNSVRRCKIVFRQTTINDQAGPVKSLKITLWQYGCDIRCGYVVSPTSNSNIKILTRASEDHDRFRGKSNLNGGSINISIEPYLRCYSYKTKTTDTYKDCSILGGDSNFNLYVSKASYEIYNHKFCDVTVISDKLLNLSIDTYKKGDPGYKPSKYSDDWGRSATFNITSRTVNNFVTQFNLPELYTQNYVDQGTEQYLNR